MINGIKKFFKNIPLAIGLVLTLMAFVMIIDNDYEQGFMAGFAGLTLVLFYLDI